jgi:hypothetical protein
MFCFLLFFFFAFAPCHHFCCHLLLILCHLSSCIATVYNVHCSPPCNTIVAYNGALFFILCCYYLLCVCCPHHTLMLRAMILHLALLLFIMVLHIALSLFVVVPRLVLSLLTMVPCLAMPLFIVVLCIMLPLLDVVLSLTLLLLVCVPLHCIVAICYDLFHSPCIVTICCGVLPLPCDVTPHLVLLHSHFTPFPSTHFTLPCIDVVCYGSSFLTLSCDLLLEVMYLPSPTMCRFWSLELEVSSEENKMIF